MSEDREELAGAIESLNQLLDYDLKTLTRRDELGQTFSFENVIQPASKVVGIFRLLPVSHLPELAEKELGLIQQSADSFLHILESIQTFDPEDPSNNTARRDQIIEEVENQYQPIFSKLSPLISYLATRRTDFSTLASDARAAIQGAKRTADEIVSEVKEQGAEAEATLKTIRAVAAEHGVSQQAIHFQTAYEEHSKLASDWATRTVWIAVLLGLLTALSVFIHKWSFLTPTDTYEAVQLALSKTLLFGVAGFMLVLSARNFAAHKHNAIVNKHRQNALVTFKALVDAASVEGKQDIVLMQAAECIFSVRDSGFTKPSQNAPNTTSSLMQLLPRSLSSAGDSA